MNRNKLMKVLAVAGGLILGFALTGVTMTVMQSLVTNDWGNLVLAKLVVLTVLTAIGAAILGDVFGDYFDNDQHDGTVEDGVKSNFD